MELMTPSGGTIFWTTVTFVILLLLLGKFAWRPILAMLDERESRIRESLEQAEKAGIAARQTLAEQDQILEAARKEAQDLLAKSRKSAEITKDEIIKKAGTEAEALITKARREIEMSRDKAMEDIRDLAVELSMNATAQLIGRSLDAKDHQALIDDSLTKLGKLN